MSLTSLLVRDVTIISPGSRTDAYGDAQPTWSSPSESTTVGWLAQQGTIEDRNGRNATSTTLSLTLPAGTPVTARDRVRIDGLTYEIIGHPLAAWTRRGEHHIEVILGEVIG